MRLSRLMFLSLVSAVLVARTAGANTPLSADQLAGKKLYTGKCARCHQLYDPKPYDDEHWNRWIVKMGSKARLSDEQYRQLVTYLDSLRHPVPQKSNAKGAN